MNRHMCMYCMCTCIRLYSRKNIFYQTPNNVVFVWFPNKFERRFSYNLLFVFVNVW